MIPSLIVLSHYQAESLIRAKGNTAAEVSPDLGLTTVTVALQNEKICFPNGEYLSWGAVDEIAANENNCFVVEGGDVTVVQAFSETFERVYTLYPTESAPTMLVSGLPMHRIKDTDPWRDTQSKIRAMGRVSGQVLDTATGLGYTAIMAAKTAGQVTSIELDPAAQDIARHNPWSQPLFDNPKITQIIGDTYDEIEEFDSSMFSCIIHDPPMFRLAGDLYSLAFYRQAFRVLKPGGCMFHYIGNPHSKSGGRVTRGVIRRLQEAGFLRITPRPQAFGVVAYK
ncbi:MAG: methyltransferase domain-containing protein [Chloroflexota bacterium]